MNVLHLQKIWKIFFESFVSSTTFNKFPLNTRYTAGVGGREGGILKVSKNKKKENLNDEKSPFSSASGDFLKADYENKGEGYVRERHQHLASNVLNLT